MKYLEYMTDSGEQRCKTYAQQTLEYEKKIAQLESEIAKDDKEIHFNVHRSAALRRSHALCMHEMQACKGKLFFWRKVAEAQATPNDYWGVCLDLELLLNDESLHGTIKQRFAKVLGN